MHSRIRKFRAALALRLFGVAVHAQAPEKFTIRQALSAPFPTELTASPRGDAVAWIFDSEGANNIWVATAPSWKGRAVTNFPAETGLELSTPEWLPDGSGLVFTSGVGPNDRGETPNPAHDPRGTRQVVMRTDLDGHVHELGEGRSPEVSPDGKTVAFVHGGSVWSVSLAPGASAARLFAARGSAGNVRWSPTGGALAFVSRRGDHGFVGVYDVRASRLTYLDPSVDDDGDQIWSPDGTRVAFIRVPAHTRQAVHARLSAPARHGRSASRMCAQGRDVRSGARRPAPGACTMESNSHAINFRGSSG